VSTLRISLFGKLSVRRGQSESLVIEALKAQELLCFLLLHRERPQPRELLASVLWADLPGERGRQYLRKALWQVQSALGETEAARPDPILRVGHDDIAINHLSDLWVDATSFEEAFASTRGTTGRQLDPSAAAQLQVAVGLYQGELLEGWYQEWCIRERERFDLMHLAALDKLMSYCEGRRDFERGLEYGFAILQQDRARERTHRALMRLYYLAGDRTGALRQFQRCETALREELDVSPSARTVALLEHIRAGSSDAATPPEPFEPASPDVEAGVRGLLVSLNQVDKAIRVLRAQLARQIGSSNRTDRA
jgi:DNA-binding SARP family transcriptional activator